MTTRRSVDPPKPEPSSALRRAVILAVAVAASVATGAAAAVLFWARTPARDTQVARFTLPITGRQHTHAVPPRRYRLARRLADRLRCRRADLSPARRRGGGTASGWRRSRDPPGVLSGRAIAGVLGGRRAQTDLDCRRCAGDDLSGHARAVRHRLGRQRDPVHAVREGTDARVMPMAARKQPSCG